MEILNPVDYIRMENIPTERAKAIDESELRVLGIDALNKALGPAEALDFLALFHHEPTDYVEISKRLVTIQPFPLNHYDSGRNQSPLWKNGCPSKAP